MKEQTRNTEVQINEEKISTLPEKQNQNNSKDDQKPWNGGWRKCKNWMEKMQKNQLTKT